MKRILISFLVLAIAFMIAAPATAMGKIPGSKKAAAQGYPWTLTFFYDPNGILHPDGTRTELTAVAFDLTIPQPKIKQTPSHMALQWEGLHGAIYEGYWKDVIEEITEATWTGKGLTENPALDAMFKPFNPSKVWSDADLKKSQWLKDHMRLYLKDMDLRVDVNVLKFIATSTTSGLGDLTEDGEATGKIALCVGTGYGPMDPVTTKLDFDNLKSTINIVPLPLNKP